MRRSAARAFGERYLQDLAHVDGDVPWKIETVFLKKAQRFATFRERADARGIVLAGFSDD
jgi:hypothetical protein